MTPKPTGRTAGTSHSERWTDYVAFVTAQSKQAGVRARLRRSLRADDSITADAYWILGGWLPENADEALVMARTAGWIAAHQRSSPEPRRTIAGEIARADYRGSTDVARRLLEATTREGVSTAVRCHHITRALQAAPDPKRIDWAQMGSDLIGLTRGGEWAHSVRSRWYREYHRLSPQNEQTETQERNPE